MNVSSRHIRISIAIALVAVLISILLPSCRKSVKLRTDAVLDRAAIPVLEAHQVSTLISDSGVTRYRINAETWQMYDKAQPPYWEFKDGIYLENFDINLNVNASLKADYAYYDEEAQTWLLRGNVHALNLEGEEFETPELNWNQKTERVYSDSIITIHRESSIIRGIGFRSNQEMTQYTILKPTGVFPLKD